MPPTRIFPVSPQGGVRPLRYPGMSGTGSPTPSRWAGERLATAPGPLVLVTVGVAYLALTQMVMSVHGPVTNGVTVWPAAGLTLAVLLMTPRHRWVWALGAVALAQAGGDLAWGSSVGAALGWTLTSTGEPLVGALLLRRLGNPAGALAPVRNLLMFLLAGAVVAPACGATFGSAVSAATGLAPFTHVWAGYFIGHALGVLVVAPVLLAPHVTHHRSRREVTALCLATTFVSSLVFTDFGGSWMVTMPYVLVPFFAWSALRFGTWGTACTSLGVTAFGSAFTAIGLGPFALAGGPQGTAVTLLQVFLAVTVCFSLLLAALVSDLSERREIEEALRHQATHDVLTGLPNRSPLTASLGSVLADSAARPGVCLLVCDLDHFKAINDRVGHTCGDQLLVEVARRLGAGVRERDLVARMSGDEFVVLLTDVDADAARRVARRLVDQVAEPVHLDGTHEVRPSMSVGAALAAPGETADSLFRAADAALYHAKHQGRGRVVVVDDAVRRQAAIRVGVEDELPRAFEDDQLVAYFQPVIALDEGHVAGAEAMVRWRHPELGLLDAERFLPAVEAMGWGDRLLDAVLAQALRAQQAWAREASSGPRVSVNVSPLLLGSGAATTAVLRALTDADVPPEALSLEVSARHPLDDAATAALHQVRSLGVHLVLDGVGTGWSSMDRLARVPWDLLKIDRTFVSDLGSDPAAATPVRALVAMSQALGIRTGADGVTRPAQLETLAEVGVDVAQGPLFSRPGTAEEVGRMLATRQVWISEDQPA